MIENFPSDIIGSILGAVVGFILAWIWQRQKVRAEQVIAEGIRRRSQIGNIVGGLLRRNLPQELKAKYIDDNRVLEQLDELHSELYAAMRRAKSIGVIEEDTDEFYEYIRSYIISLKMFCENKIDINEIKERRRVISREIVSSLRIESN